MKYYWPLVLIGGTLLVLGAALPWTKVSGGMRTLWQPASEYQTGFLGAGLLPAVGGGVLLLIALIAKGEPDSHPFTLIVAVLSGLLIVGGACAQFQTFCGDCGTYSPAFGLGVSLVGALLAILGSEIRLSGADRMMTQLDILILAALELFIICVGLALVTQPALGDWLGFWHTVLPPRPCGLTPLNVTGNRVAEYTAQCYATATAKAIQLTPPAWWPGGQ